MGQAAAPEFAKEIFGAERYLGPEAVRATFNIELPEAKEEIPFTREELERAEKEGFKLIYRPTHDAEGTPITMQALMEAYSGDGRAITSADDDIRVAIDEDMEFFTQEAPTGGWNLVGNEILPETAHLSQEAQQAFMDENFTQLDELLPQIQARWDKEGVPKQLQPDLPSIATLRDASARLPDGVQMPKAIDVFMDLMVAHTSNGEKELSNVAISTTSRNQELPQINEPERPIDIGLFDNSGVDFHWRRDMKWGRPDQTKDGYPPGLPIGHLQISK